MSETCGIIVLAAGKSSRLGQSKQLLKYKEYSLLEHAVVEARKAFGEKVIIVSGAERESVEAKLIASGIKTVYNPEWESGMASSIRYGLTHLTETLPGVENCIISVCDQPFVSAELFTSLIMQQMESGKGIIACSYGDTLGVPALFTKTYFSGLLDLTGHQGAKKLIETHFEDVCPVQFPEGEVDIDTLDDYQKLLGLK